MISKLITWADTRDSAIERMQTALDQYQIGGVTTNIAFLAALFADDNFQQGDFSTNFIEQHYPKGFNRSEPDQTEKRRLHAAATVTGFLSRQHEASISGTMRPPTPITNLALVVIDNGNQFAFEVSQEKDDQFTVTSEGKTTQLLTDWKPAQTEFNANIDGQDVIMQWHRTSMGCKLSNAKHVCDLKVMSPKAADKYHYMPVRKAVDTSSLLLSPMPGLLVDVMVKEGDTVSAGDSLAVVEAMKMENVLKAERSGTIAKIVTSPGSTLDVDQKILEFEA